MNQYTDTPQIPQKCNLANKISWFMQSKVFAKSQKIPPTCILQLIDLNTQSVSLKAVLKHYHIHSEPTPRSLFIFEKLTVTQLCKKFLAFHAIPPINIIVTWAWRWLLSKWCAPFKYSVQILNTFLIYPPHTTCPIQLLDPDLIISLYGKQYLTWSSSLFTFLHSPVTAPLLGPNILTSTLFSTLFSVLKLTDEI